MKKSVDPQLVKNIATQLHDSISWINDFQSDVKEKKKLDSEIYNFFLNCRHNLVLESLLSRRESMTKLFKMEDYIKDLQSQKIPNFSYHVPYALAQEFKQYNTLIVNSPKFFAERIRISEKMKDINNSSFFAYITFPSIFSYFVFPEIASKAIEFLKELSLQEDDIAFKCCASFYLSYPTFSYKFCDRFFNDLINEMLLSSSDDEKSVSYTNITIMKLYQILIKNLKPSILFLNSYHRDLSNYLFFNSYEFFSKLVFEYILRPILYRYAETITDQTIKSAVLNLFSVFFSYLINNGNTNHDFRLNTSANLILKQFYDSPTSYNQFDDIGGIGGLGYTNYPSFITLYEASLIYDIAYDGTKTKTSIFKTIYKKLPPEKTNTFITTFNDIYNTFDNKINDPALHKSIQLVKLPHIRLKYESEDYVRLFQSLDKNGRDHNVDFFSLINNVTDKETYAMKVFRKFSTINDDQFKLYCNSKFNEKYYQSLLSFNIMLSAMLIKQYIKNFNNESLDYKEILFSILTKKYYTQIKTPYFQAIYQLYHRNCDSILNTQLRENLSFILLKRVNDVFERDVFQEFFKKITDKNNPHKEEIQNLSICIRLLNLKDPTTQLILFPNIIKQIRSICNNDGTNSLILLNTLLYKNHSAPFYSSMLIYLKFVGKLLNQTTDQRKFITYINDQWMFTYQNLSTIVTDLPNLCRPYIG